MQVGFMVEPQLGGSYDDLVRLARWAETTGFDVFARSDHYLDHTTSHPTTDAFTSLGGLARETTTIALAVLVTPISFRHPAVIAKAAATLDEMSEGRFELGIGTGWMEGEHRALGLPLPGLAERYSRFEEALRYLSRALGRTAGAVNGDHYRLDDVELQPRPRTDLRVIIGGSGPRRTPDLAGRFADEYNLFTVHRDAVRPRVDNLRASAAAAGRRPEAITVSALVTPIVGTGETDYRRRLEATAQRRGTDPGSLLARFTERGIPHGAMEQAAEGFAAIAALGVGRLYLQQFEALADVDLDNAALALESIRSR